MRSRLLLLFSLFILFSCKKEPTYETRLVFLNSVDSTIHVELYPKPEYCSNDLYRSSSTGSCYSQKSFDLFDEDYIYLYYSDNYFINPTSLLSQIFDSVEINVRLDTTIAIKFQPGFFQHYTQNIYTSASIWSSKYFIDYLKTKGSSQEIHVHQLTFSINIDSIQ